MSSRLPRAAPRLLVVEDNDFTRMTLSAALVTAGLDVVGETGSAAEPPASPGAGRQTSPAW